MSRATHIVLLAAICAAAAFAAGASSAATKAPPACFGAAARDDARPCENPKLRFSVSPDPGVALLLAAQPCTFVRTARPSVCAFGAPRRSARATVGLLGDSHAPAWRATVDVLARGRRWRGLTLARSSCPFSYARRSVDEGSAAECSEWIRDSLAWFERHPEVRTVFFVNSAAYNFLPEGGQDAHAAAVAGYRAALDALPPSVRQIIVIRDNPKGAVDTNACVRRALARRQRPGLRCALPRDESLLRDAATEAAAQLAGGRGRSIDLSRFFCDDTLCYPVVGGAFVFKDESHITRVFGRTLGPYLAAAYRALAPP